MISRFSDQKLLLGVKSLVAQERLTLEKILEHLQEIHRRRLYADLGYSSLFKYLVKELKYSEGAAARRVGALKLVTRLPEAKKMIAKGELNLTVASQAQTFTQDKNLKETRSVLTKIKNKTKDEATVEFLKMTPDDTAARSERKERVTPDETRIHLNLKNFTLDRLEKFKAIKKLSSSDAIDQALELALAHYEKSLSIINKTSRTRTKGRHIPSAVKKKVLKRADSCCEFPGCGEIRCLEFEHVVPFSKGGGHEEGNIRLYCKAHNQRAAIIQFGQSKMDSHLNLI